MKHSQFQAAYSFEKIQRAAELAASQVDWDEDSGAEAIDSDGEVV